MIEIAGVLSPEECDAICECIADDDLWHDGGDTAQGGAKALKKNL